MKSLLFVAVNMLLSFLSSAQNTPDTAIRNAAANNGLQKFKKLMIADPKTQANSFLSLSMMDSDNRTKIRVIDTAKLEFGNPVITAIIRLDRLKEYKSGQPVSGFITDVGIVIYPIVDKKNKQISTLTVEKNGEKWNASSFGIDNDLMKLSIPYLSEYKTSSKIIRIPSLHVNFVSFTKSGNTYFIPLKDDKEKQLFKGKPVDAQIILEKYVQDANRQKDLPM